MNDLEILLIVLLAIITMVFAIVLYLMQSRSSSEKEKLIKKYEDEKDVLQERITLIMEEKAAMASKLEAIEEYDKKLREVQESQHKKDMEQMKLAFENLSEKNSLAFKARSTETIAELLKPVQEKFKEFTESVKDSQKSSIERHSRLEQKIEDLDKQSRSVGDEARNLANALTGYSKIQGDFGEMLLVDVLKNSGLTEGIHFLTQGVMTDESGREIRSEQGRAMIPDVMVFYPDDTVVIIDSKLSLAAYNDFMRVETAQERKAFAKQHIESVKRHVKELQDKDYASYLVEGKRKVNYNIMFIPVEGAFRLMLEEEPRLWQMAKDNNVLIVSQMTLVIVLNMIQMSWKQYNQEKNINEVYATVSELMSQLSAWLTSFDDLGTSIEKASANYGKAKQKLLESNQSVIKKIKKLEKLGATPKRSKEKIKATSRLHGEHSIIPQSLDIIENDENN